MPTIPLFETPPNANAWHRVRSPGGYEWWNFAAASDDGETEISATFHDGYPLHPRYLAAYRKYLKNPTQNPPPTPADFPYSSLTITRRGKKPKTYGAVAPFVSADDAVRVSVGPDEFYVYNTGVVHVIAGNKKRSAIEFAFASPPIAPLSVSLQANHQWIIPAARCDVTGTIWTKGKSSPFKGVGYRDHYFGAGPIENDIRNWFGGRLFIGQRVLAFHIVSLVDRQAQAAIRLVDLTPDAARELEVTAASMDIHRRVPWRAPYPSRVAISDMILRKPKLLASRPRWQRLSYEGTFGGQTGRAVCEMIHPRR